MARIRSGALFVALACCLPMRAWAAADRPPPVTPPPPTSLQVLPEAGLTIPARDEIHFDFGSVSKLDQDKLEHTFTFKNDGIGPLRIDRVRASCGCTSVLLGVDGHAVTLKPGDTVQVKVGIDLSLLNGSIHKSVMLYCDDVAEPLATIGLSAQIREAIALSSELIDFGDVRAGSGATLSLTLNMDTRIVELMSARAQSPASLRIGDGHIKFPTLECSNPNFILEPKSASLAGANLKLDYWVKLLPRAAIGAITGTIGLVPAEFPVRLHNDLQRQTVSLAGEVLGEVAAVPNSVVLGTVTAGHHAAASVTIYGDAGIRAADLKIEDVPKWIAATLKPIPAGSASAVGGTVRPAIAIVELTISEKAPVGLLRGEVRIVAIHNERLAIPVLCYVVEAYP